MESAALSPAAGDTDSDAGSGESVALGIPATEADAEWLAVTDSVGEADGVMDLDCVMPALGVRDTEPWRDGDGDGVGSAVMLN